MVMGVPVKTIVNNDYNFLNSFFTIYSNSEGFQSSHGTAKHVVKIMKEMLEKQ